MRHSRLVVGLSVGIVAAGASLAVLLSFKTAPTRSHEPRAALAAPGDPHEILAPAAPSQVLASTRGVKPISSPRAQAATTPPSALPDSLDAVPSTPWREAQLARYSEGERAMLDYKLGLMARMRECADDIEAEGTLNLFLHYTSDPGTGVAKGSGVDPLDSSLNREADESALECVRRAHLNQPMPLPEAGPEQREFHWATEIVFPLEKDRAYQFFAH